jgi:2-polyprenyl-3-methyl-5-hydroxy-6-metoxy-1,4-benzoquinol methylase
MPNLVATICGKIAALDPIQGKRLKSNLGTYDYLYHLRAESFFRKYAAILAAQGKDLDYAIDCYLKMIADVDHETVGFLHTGKYSSSSFDEVNSRVYAQPGIMEYYMHGLILSQFLWKHHYLMFDYYISTLPQHVAGIHDCLEVGAGHGFYLAQTLETLRPDARMTVVDISETSIAMARAFAASDRIGFQLRDIFHFDSPKHYDFITLGEVLEHVEQPLDLLIKLKGLLSVNGILFFTTPTNAPAIDHLYLFRRVEEIRQLVKTAGFRILSERPIPSEDLPWEKADDRMIPILYGAFLTT